MSTAMEILDVVFYAVVFAIAYCLLNDGSGGKRDRQMAMVPAGC